MKRSQGQELKSSETVAYQQASDYVNKVVSYMSNIDLYSVTRVFTILQQARDNGATIFVAGNGGSAATASHWANDLGKATKRSGQTFIRVVCLNDNTSWLTALANDEGYDRVFSGQLENFSSPDDVLVVISASGNSPNLLRSVELAKDRQMTTVAFLGFDGGALKDMVDEPVWIPTPVGEYEAVEDCHMSICHTLAGCLSQDRSTGPSGNNR